MNAAARTRRATNVSLSADVLEEAKSYDLNISRICDEALKKRVMEERAKRWAEENTEFIAEYNAIIEREGLPLEEHRMF